MSNDWDEPPSAKDEACAEKGPANGWSEKRKKRQACNARRNKPWQSSTGPRTEDGKKAVSQNALKHGLDSAAIKKLRAVLRAQRALLKTLTE